MVMRCGRHMRRVRVAVGLGCVAVLQAQLMVVHAHAVPAAVAAAHAPSRQRWTEHRVIPGERLKEIAERHGVTIDDLVRWNDLDRDNLRIVVGQKLKVQSNVVVPNRERIRCT